jgi:hypothetical protein
LNDLLNRVQTILSVRVPEADRSISPLLVTQAALTPLLNRVQNFESILEEEFYGILAEVGVALDFRNGRSVSVRYADRLSGSQEGQATPDAYHPWTRLAIFCDSSRHHAGREDRARDNGVNAACLLRGISPLRFTTEQIRFSRGKSRQ